MGTNVISKDTLETHALTQLASARASANPLPGPLSDAFTRSAIPVGDLMVRKVVAADWQTLKELDSPLLKLIAELHQSGGKDSPDVDSSEQEDCDLCWIFTHSPDDVEELITQGRDQFQARSKEISKTLDKPIIELIKVAIMHQLAKSWQTAIKYKSEMEKAGVRFFPEPPTQPQTGSDGGSTTLPVS